MVKKMKVSETEIWPVMRGILMVMREPMKMVMKARNQNRISSGTEEILKIEKRDAAAPRAMIAHM
jgi:hypothetical protein